MIKSLFLALPLSLLSLTAAAQVELSTSDLIRLHSNAPGTPEAIRKSAPACSADNRVELIIRYDSPAALEEIEARGGEIISLAGTRTAIVAVDPDKAEEIAAAMGVTGAQLSVPIKRVNDKALPMSGVTDVWKGTGLPKGFDGSGTVIGIFDTGIDPNHINFKDADGNSRVSRIWHYESTSSRPTVYDTPSKIRTFSADTGTESHGTHVLGVMTGSFVDPSDSEINDFRGVAPGAEIVVGAGEGYNAQIIDAVQRIAQYAQSQNKPCVINLSFGDSVGPHDGTDEFTETISDIAAKYNAVICLAAGNERDQPISIIKALPEENPTLQTMLVKSGIDMGGSFQVYGPMEIWTTDDTPFTVTLDIIDSANPDEALYSYEVPVTKEGYVVQGNNIKNFLPNTNKMDLINDNSIFQELFSNSFMGGICGLNSKNNRYNAKLNFYIEGRKAAYVNKYFIRVRVTGNPGQKIFMYTDGVYIGLGNNNLPGLDVPDGNGTNSNMGCGKETFCVGSYTSANRKETNYEFGTIGDISYFSSYGETPDGRVMPDVAAPGQVIVSSRNSYMPTNTQYLYYYPVSYSYKDQKTNRTYNWTPCAGTSQATPHVAGIFALMRSVNPDLSTHELFRIVRESASEPEFDTPGWGYGKANAYAAIKQIIEETSVYNLTDRNIDGLIIEPTTDGYIITGAEGDTLTAEIFDLSGVRRIGVSDNTSSLSISTSSLDKGTYVLRICGINTSKSIKIAVTR